MTAKRKHYLARLEPAARRRVYVRLFGLSFVIAGIVKEFYHGISQSPEMIWGARFGITLCTSSMLIVMGYLIIACSFKKIMELIKIKLGGKQ